jgi:nicotinamidase-related amidase
MDMTTSRRVAAPHPTVIDRQDSILLVIDLQDGFLNKLAPERREAVIDHCRFLVEAAGHFAVPIFVTVEDTPRNGTTVERVYGCIDPPVPQRDKRIFGLCSQDDLRNAILEQPNRTAILIGMDTDVCVLHSAAGLLSEGFRTVIVSDATEAPGLARDHGLARAQFLGAELVSARGLYYEWMRSVDGLKKVESGARIAPPVGTLL